MKKPLTKILCLKKPEIIQKVLTHQRKTMVVHRVAKEAHNDPQIIRLTPTIGTEYLEKRIKTWQ